MRKSLFALAVGGFGIGLTEFTIMGLLVPVSQDLGVSIPQAGYLISAYASGVVFGAPGLTLVTGGMSPKKVLILLMFLFTCFNGLSALAPGYKLLLVARFLSGLPHGAYFGVGACVASQLAGKGKEGGAVAIMFSGLTLANVFGVPLATFIGYRFGWRPSFALVSLVGVFSMVALKRWIPSIKRDAQAHPLEDLKILTRVDLWLAIGMTSIGFGGFFAWMSYISPFFTEVAGFQVERLPFLLTLAGIGMTFGTFLGGKLADLFSPLKSAFILLLCLAALLGLNATFGSYPIVIVPLTFLTGMVAMALGSPLQILLMQESKGAEMFGASLGQASFNIGNSLGAYLGGIPIRLGCSFTSPLWVGSVLNLCGMVICLVLGSRKSNSEQL